MNIAELIEKHDPCISGKQWLIDNNIQTVAEAYDKCERSDWLIWLLVEVKGIDKKQRIELGCKIIRTIWHLLTDDRSKTAIKVAERWCRGEANDEELREAAYAHAAYAYAAAHAADAAAAAYAYAAYADAAYAAAYAADVAYAADAAAYAYAAAYADYAAYAAAYAAKKEQHAKQCKIVRDMYPNPF
jgi:hypothetical protein